MKNYKLYQKVIWCVEDFDGTTTESAFITEVYPDHCIATTEDGMNLWIDEDTDEEFIIIDKEV